MIHTEMTKMYFDFQYCPTHLIPQVLTIRDRVTTRGGYLGFRMDRAAHSMRGEAEQSQVADLLMELL